MAGFIQGRLASGEESAIKETLDYVIPQDWKLDAECSRLGRDGKPMYDPDMWYIEKRPPTRFAKRNGVLSNKMAIDQAMEICNTLCPVRAECWDEATEYDVKVSVRGGIAPRVAIVKSPGRPIRTECRNGHDTTSPGSRNADGQCRECRRIQHRESYAKNREFYVVESKDDTTDTAA